MFHSLTSSILSSLLFFPLLLSFHFPLSRYMRTSFHTHSKLPVREFVSAQLQNRPYSIASWEDAKSGNRENLNLQTGQPLFYTETSNSLTAHCNSFMGEVPCLHSSATPIGVSFLLMCSHTKPPPPSLHFKFLTLPFLSLPLLSLTFLHLAHSAERRRLFNWMD